MTAGGRAITLIELLIVLAIALAIGAISLRGAFSWSEDEQLKAVQSGLSSAALEARSLSLAEQRPVELVVEETERGTFRVGTLAPVEPRSDSADAFGLQDDPVTDLMADLAVDPVLDETLNILYELPAGMIIEDETGGVVEEVSAFGDGSARISLMLLMPDGSARLSDSSWALVRDELRYLPSLEAWTARLTFTQEDLEQDEAPFTGGLPDESPGDIGGER